MRTEIVYEVAWDGTRARNPYVIVAPEVPQDPPPPPPAPMSVAQQVIDALRHGGMSARRLTAAMEMPGASVNNALYRLQAAGFVEVCGTGWNHARGQTEQIYGLTEKGRRA